MDKFQAPATYEEAVERKENLLNKLNKYNEELLEGKEPSLTEEEYTLVKEEYEFLDCYVDVDAEFASSEEVTDKKFLDKVNLFVWIYAMVMFFANLYFVQQSIGYSLLSKFLTAEWLDFSKFGLWISVTGMFLIYPLGLLIIGILIKLFAFKKDAASKKTFKYVFIGHIIFMLINFVVCYFVVIDMCYHALVGA
jgi:hypothetical protein